MKTRLLHFVVILVVLTTSSAVHALKSDRDKPMDIEADRVDVDDNKGISTFRGNVHVQRGTMHIRGEIVVVRRDANSEINTIVATGNDSKRALYRQRPDNKPTDVIGQARRIHYDAKKEIVTLKKQGEIQQAKDTFKGELLIYHAKTDRVSASGVDKKNGDNGRVRMRLQPSNKTK